MKRLLALMLAAALALSLVACGDGDSAGGKTTSPTTSTPENNESQNDPETPPEDNGPVKLYMNEPATIGAFELTITDTTFVESYKSGTMLH